MKLRFTLAALLLAPLAAQAAVYTQILPEQSSVRFGYQQMGVDMDGSFNTLNGELHFDTEAPENTRVELKLDLASVDTGLDEANEELAKSEWFDSASNPLATFTADQVTPKSADQYLVNGLLEIKGQQRPVSFTATLTQDGNNATLTGQLPIKRSDFTVGEGPWAAFDVVANEVTIDFTIAVAPAN